jgi:hypothetical protein
MEGQMDDYIGMVGIFVLQVCVCDAVDMLSV